MNNINYTGDNPCSSCGLCAVLCSHKAIDLHMDRAGFYKPTVNGYCIDCGICNKVCYKYLEAKEPFENTFNDKSIYAAWSKDKDTILSSSSGGVGYELTNYFFEKSYKICGCIFDGGNDICKHIIAETTEYLEIIKTSKYLQSYTVNAFQHFRKDEKYLVFGTPCQIYGLRKYIQLKHWEENFILVDFFCHGTPSFNLWKKYKKYICKTWKIASEFEAVNFRKKSPESGWHKNAILIRDSSGAKLEISRAFANDLFFKFFLNNSCLNDACYECKLRLDYCASDIRIADFWGKKYASNDDGVSLVIINTEKGKNVFDEIRGKIVVENCDFNDLLNSQSIRFIIPNRKRKVILEELKGEKSLEKIYRKYFRFEELYRRSIIRRGIFFVIRKFFKEVQKKDKIVIR